MKHYVVLYDWSVENKFIANGIEVVGVAHSLEEAKKMLAEAATDEKAYAEKYEWEIFEDSDVEFDAGESGNYDAEHAHYFIKEVK